jgi:hypothetical protein
MIAMYSASLFISHSTGGYKMAATYGIEENFFSIDPDDRMNGFMSNKGSYAIIPRTIRGTTTAGQAGNAPR